MRRRRIAAHGSGCRGFVLAAAVGLALLGTAHWAGADLLRCTGPDGRTVFTDDPAVCPGAAPYEPSGRVESVDPVEPAASGLENRLRAVERRRLADQAAAGEAKRWQQKKLEKQAELREVDARRGDLMQLITWCNRGGRVVTYDNAGIKQAMPCSDLRAELKDLDVREASIRDYLANTLPEECRRAGCQPGWIR